MFHWEGGSCLTRSGLRQLIEWLAKAAGITEVRHSPHTSRHTVANWALCNGMNVFSLQVLLGHEDLAMTRRYVAVAVASADVERQHRIYSPVRRLSGREEAAAQ